jgi:hypothetical protein
MAMKIDIAGTNISAPQMSEFFRLAALPENHVNRATFQAYLEGRSPFAFERNEHGHVIITFTGLDLTGADEIKRFEAAGFRVGDYAKYCFTSTKADGYDKNHRLVAGQTYKIALVPGKEIERDSDRLTVNLQKLGEKYGYGKPLGGHIPRIRESVSDKQMKEMGFVYIVSLHDPIKDSGGFSRVLDARRRVDSRWVGTGWGRPNDQWSDSGAFAFPVFAS